MYRGTVLWYIFLFIDEKCILIFPVPSRNISAMTKETGLEETVGWPLSPLVLVFSWR